MYIKNLFIKNYRNIKECSLNLKPKTLIIGENNVGKTNILNAISLLLNNEISMSWKRTLKIEDFNYEVIQTFKRQISNENVDAKSIMFPKIEIIVTFCNFINEDEKTIVSEWHTDDTHEEAQLKLIYHCKLRNPIAWVEKIRAGFKPDDSDEQKIDAVQFPIQEYQYEIRGGVGNIRPDNFQLKAMKIDLLDALRDAKTELSASKENRLLYRVLSNRDDGKFDDILESAKTLNQSINDKNEELTIIKGEISRVLEILSLETDNLKNNINFSFSDINVPELLKKIGLEYGDNPISVENNGLGRNNLLYISLILSHIQSKDEEPDFRLIAIEEPEAHINPILQKHFAESISRENFFSNKTRRQILLTSHSTHINSHLDLENTVVLYRDAEDKNLKSHYILDGISKDAEGKRIKNYLKKWISATNSVMFFSRRIIFVEGIAEQILIPKFFEMKYGVKPEKKNCQIVNVNGVAFKNFIEVVKHGYFIKVAVLTDSDTGTEAEGRATNLKQDYDSDFIRVCITCESTFEKDLISANKNGKGKKIIENTIKITRPNKYKTTLNSAFEGTFDIELIFDAIKDYKSEFAFDLVNNLEEKSNEFIIPQYIEEAFDFICGDSK